METSTLTLHRFNGEEAFRISKATAYLRPEGDEEVLFNFEFETDPDPLKTLEDTRDLGAQPAGEVTIRVKKSQIPSLVGSRFALPEYQDESEQFDLARLYYVEHEAVKDNIVEILEYKSQQLRVRWTGTTMDVNFYDGSKPSTRIVVEAWFSVKV